MKDCYFFFKNLFHIYFRAYNRLEIKGREFIPREGGLIVISNHSSYLDPLIIGAAVNRRMTFLAKKELFSIPLVGTFVSSFSLPVSREGSSHTMIKETVNRLRNGEAIAMFPAGERDKGGDGSEAGFKRGLELLARLSKVPVLPAYIKGADGSLPVGGKFPRPSRISVRFAPCLPPDNNAGGNTGGVAEEKETKSTISRAIESIGRLKTA